MAKNQSPQMNWVYIGLVACIGTAALLFIAWQVTWQFYTDWSHQQPIRGGWNWPSVIAVNIASVLGIFALYWNIYADTKTVIDDTHIWQPSLFGGATIYWAKVTEVKIFNDVGYHIYCDRKKIAVSLYAYKNPEQLAQTIHDYIMAAKKRAFDLK